MVQIFGLSRGPDRRARRAPSPPLQSGPRPPRQESLGERPNGKHIAASILVHLAVLFGIFLLPRAEPVEVIIPLVTLRIEENGAAGSAGGKAGGGGGGGHGSAASQSASAEPPTEASEPTPSPPTPPIPTPPTPPTPNIRPETQVPQALAPAPVILPPPPKPPPPKPVVRPRPPAAKPTPHLPETVAETPAPTPAPTVATEPPPGPSNGQGAPAQNAQPGTAATGTASAGPGGAVGVGTGAVGAGRGSFGNGKGSGDDYLDRLHKWLLKYLKYPPEARARKQEGTVWVRIVIARDGTVLDAQIQNSSGFPLLDAAILDMVHAASPVPALPAEVAGDTAKIGLPFKFTIGFFDKVFH